MDVQMEKSVSVTSLAGNLHDCDKCLEPGRTYRTQDQQRGQGELKKALPANFVLIKAGNFSPSESALNDLKERRQIFVRIMVDVGKENIGVKVCNNL